jgi:hypothetical protein
MPGGPYFLRNSNISLLNRLDVNLKRLVAHPQHVAGQLCAGIVAKVPNCPAPIFLLPVEALGP